MKRSRWFLALGALAATLGVYGLHNAGANAQGSSPARFRVWLVGAQDTSKQIEKALTAGAAKLGTKLEFAQNVSGDKLLAAIQGGDPPELVLEADPGTMGTLTREGLTENLDPLIKTGGVNVKDIVPATLGQCTYYGHLYCLPWGTDTLALLWNRDAFKAAGLPDRAPTTLEELVSFSKKLTKTDAQGNVTQLGFVPNYAWSHTDIYSMLFGGNFYSSDGKRVTIATAPVQQALEWQAQFYTVPGVDKVDRIRSGFGDGAQDGFIAGKVAMGVNGEWLPSLIKDSRPSLRYGVAPIPYPAAHPERKNLTVLGGTVAFIPSNVKDKAFAWRFMSYLQTPKVVADTMIAGGNIPTSLQALNDPRLRQDKQFAAFVDLTKSPNAKPFPVSLVGAELATQFGPIEEKAIRGKLPDLKKQLEALQTSLQTQLTSALQSPPK
jgi:multiple sugar transport system substrate-binding protein